MHRIKEFLVSLLIVIGCAVLIFSNFQDENSIKGKIRIASSPILEHWRCVRHSTKHACYLIVKTIVKSEVLLLLSAAVINANQPIP